MKYDPERDYAVIGDCKICSQGRLFIAREKALQKLFVYCEECESEWESPEATHSPEQSTWGKHGDSALVEYDDLKNHPWLEAVDNYRRPTIR